jgi:hypothetical protein
MFLFQVSLESLCTLISSGNLPLLRQHCTWHETPVRHRQSPTYKLDGLQVHLFQSQECVFPGGIVTNGGGEDVPR